VIPWWTDYPDLVLNLEQHALRADSTICRLSCERVRVNPVLRRYYDRFERWWMTLGYQALAEGPWPPRRLVTLFPAPPWAIPPIVLCLDGPTDSPHRIGSHELCIWYPHDPPERRWHVNDGLVRLFDLARRHLLAEHVWRERGGHDRDWPIDQAPHGAAPSAPARPDLALAPAIPFTRTGNPTLTIVR
jgi:hypothetical protein